MSARSIAVVVAMVGLCPALGCFKSSTTQASFESSSDSSMSPFKSSSESSSPDEDDEESAYERDVRDLAVRFGASADDVMSFQRDLSGIAEGYGVTDWERRDGTYFAIGAGLARADLDDQRFGQLAVELANEDLERLELIKAGYATYQAR